MFKATTQEVWGWTWLERLRQDIEFGIRMLRKSPALKPMMTATSVTMVTAASKRFIDNGLMAI